MPDNSASHLDDRDITVQTLHWVKHFIVDHQICPFARRELERETIRVSVVRSKKLDVALDELVAELQWLDAHPDTETSLLVFPTLFRSFDAYLDYIELAESLMVTLGYEGVYQLATFHPDYCFEGAEVDDAANYSNRSPYAMVHVLREASVERAIEAYGDTQQIPERNMTYLDAMGAQKAERFLQAALDERA
ncbi:DUF1415 domain-containing protein [Halomonas dongshanensis]|uniref:DUF1415 domain-containing protein n=1 Tax=Halomonas dongshanensis TaxID=2890835 RepID=A0ABT2EBC7_9GAMM|nr:DUF1415 domain-containing protein [Halomonas dongshanensis]MCS2608658.1 DUF1415 domain-containing protein [Halomonas dongshanensis]